MKLPDSWSRSFNAAHVQLRGRKSLWLSLVLITLFVYFTEARHGPWYVVYRYLYFIPITLAAYFHGRMLGMAVALLCTSLFLPILGQQLVEQGLSSGTVEFIATLFLFNLWAWVTGTVGGVQRRQRDFYLKLNQLGELLDQETTVERLLSVSLEQSLKLVGAEGGRILLHNPGQDYLLALDSGSPGLKIAPMAATGYSATSSRAGPTGPQPLDRWLMAHNMALVSNQVQADPRFLPPDGEGQAVNSFVAAPMRRRGDAIGLIMVVNSKDGPFDNQDLRMLEAISDRTAMAVERAWLYEAEQTKRRMADTLVEVSQIVGSTLNLDEVLNLVLDCLADVVDYDGAAIQLFSDGALRYVLSRGPGSQQVMDYTGSEEFETTWQILREKTPLVIADTWQYPGWVQVPGMEHTRSWIGAPMLIKDKVIGFLMVRKAEPDYYGPEDARVVFALANQVALAIENARLYEETKRRFEEMTALHETALDITAQLEMPKLLDAIIERASKLVGGTGGLVHLYNPAQQKLKAVTSYNLERDYTGLTLAVGEGVAGRVVETGKALIVDDYQTWAGKAPHLVGVASRAVIGIPLQWQDRVIGVLDIVDETREEAFNEDDLRLLTPFVAQAAIAIENARLYAESQRRTAELASLYEIGLATTSTLDLNKQLQLFHEQVQWLLHPDTFYIALVNEDKQELHFPLFVEEGRLLPPFTESMTDSQTLTAWIVHERKPLLIRDWKTEADSVPVPAKQLGKAPRSWLGVPLLAKDKVIGVMSVQSFDPHAFDEDDQRLLAAIANQAAVTIENARLLEAEHSRRLLADTLREVSRVVNSTLKLDEVLELILDELRKVIAYDSVSIQLLSEDELEIISARGFEDPTQVVGLKFSMSGDNPNRHVIQSKAPYIVPDTHAAYAAFRKPPHSHIRSWLGVPLLVKGEIIGMIALDKMTVGYFSREHAEVALTFANQVAMAVENARLYEETSLLAITDGLTGLHNSRYFYQELNGEILRSERYGHPCSLIFFDIDDFKVYNDRYGHLAGDDLLKELGGIIKEITRHPDTVARYGGEEFAIIQPETDQAKALLSAQRLWKRVREHEFAIAGEGRQGKITISIGVATYPQDAKTVKELVHAADMALYCAKQGKDQICVYQQALPEPMEASAA